MVSSTLMGVPSFRSWPPPLLVCVISYSIQYVKPQFYFFGNFFGDRGAGQKQRGCMTKAGAIASAFMLDFWVAI